MTESSGWTVDTLKEHYDTVLAQQERAVEAHKVEPETGIGELAFFYGENILNGRTAKPAFAVLRRIRNEPVLVTAAPMAATP